MSNDFRHRTLIRSQSRADPRFRCRHVGSACQPSGGGSNVFMPRPVALSNHDVSQAQTLAHVASIAQDQMTCESAVLKTCLQHVSQARLLVEQAKGFISARSRLDIGDASNGHRSDARSNIQRLTAVARDVIAGPAIIGSGTTGRLSPDGPPVDDASDMPLELGLDSVTGVNW